MRGQEVIKFSNISASQSFNLLNGGKYQSACIGTGFGTVQVRQYAANGVTSLSLGVSHAANGLIVFDAPPGQFEVQIVTATGVYITISRIPGE
jgi:hypothetical protein